MNRLRDNGPMTTDADVTPAHRVLIAEDEALIRLDLAEMLREEGYEVVGEAANAVQAADFLAAHPVDLVLLDVHMPGLSGLDVLAQGALQQFEQLAPDASDGAVASHPDAWQQSFEWGNDGTDGPFGSSITIVARGASLPQGKRLLVFDDVSELVSAQRAKAWGEVARRLAHEIKNPLTPIQLSAERLAMKLDGKLQGADQALLAKSVKTIVDQVDAMKRLVNEFRDYARLPAAELKPLDLNALVHDILHLYGCVWRPRPAQSGVRRPHGHGPGDRRAARTGKTL